MTKPTFQPLLKRRRRSSLEQFEQLYRHNIDSVVGYFARRCRDPQTVADLTSATFDQAADGFSAYDPRRGSDRAWLLGIADRAFQDRHDQAVAEMSASPGRGDRRPLDADELEELTRRIDREHAEDGNMAEMRRSRRSR